jgi:hypothetical protein
VTTPPYLRRGHARLPRRIGAAGRQDCATLRPVELDDWTPVSSGCTRRPPEAAAPCTNRLASKERTRPLPLIGCRGRSERDSGTESANPLAQGAQAAST